MKLKSIGLLTLLIYIVALVGCSGGQAATLNNVTSSSTQSPTKTLDKATMPPEENDWINPGIVNVGRFYAGARAEFPLTIHNGSDGQYSDLKQVITDPGEIKAPIPLKFPLAYPEDYSNVTLLSDNPNDNLKAVGYDRESQSLIIDGFAPGQGRILQIDYIGLTVFNVYFIAPYRSDEGYALATEEQKDWVIIADERPIFMPRETKDILIALDMPKKTEAPGDNWEFRIGVSRAGGGQVQVELVSRWLIAMR